MVILAWQAHLLFVCPIRHGIGYWNILLLLWKWFISWWLFIPNSTMFFAAVSVAFVGRFIWIPQLFDSEIFHFVLYLSQCDWERAFGSCLTNNLVFLHCIWWFFQVNLLNVQVHYAIRKVWPLFWVWFESKLISKLLWSATLQRWVFLKWL